MKASGPPVEVGVVERVIRVRHVYARGSGPEVKVAPRCVPKESIPVNVPFPLNAALYVGRGYFGDHPFDDRMRELVRVPPNDAVKDATRPAPGAWMLSPVTTILSK